MMEIYKENYTDAIYMEFYNYFYKEVEKIECLMKKCSNEIFELDHCYEIWIENIYSQASETLGYQIEDYDLQVEIQKDLESDFEQLQWDISTHNEMVLNEY